MALTRKFLTALDIDNAKIEEIITAHTETVEALKSEISEYKAKINDTEDVRKELETAKETIKANEKAVSDADAYKLKYEEIKTEYDNYKADISAKETKNAKETAYRSLLKENGISEKRIDSIIKITNLDEIKLADGKIKDADKVSENIKTEWADFIVSTSEKGSDTPNPPNNNGGNTFEAMSVTDKMKYANEHPNDTDVVNWLKK